MDVEEYQIHFKCSLEYVMSVYRDNICPGILLLKQVD